MLAVWPEISEKIDGLMSSSATVCANRAMKVRHTTNLVLRKSPEASTGRELHHHLPVYVWRDVVGWLGQVNIINLS